MSKYHHRIAFNADLFMTITTDSAETTLDELEKLALAEIRSVEPNTLVSDIAFELPFLPEAVVYVRLVPPAEGLKAISPDEERLENLSIENVEEV